MVTWLGQQPCGSDTEHLPNMLRVLVYADILGWKNTVHEDIKLIEGNCRILRKWLLNSSIIHMWNLVDIPNFWADPTWQKDLHGYTSIRTDGCNEHYLFLESYKPDWGNHLGYILTCYIIVGPINSSKPFKTHLPCILGEIWAKSYKSNLRTCT